MSESGIRVLAVADPAVIAYTDERYGVLKGYGKEVIFEAVPWSSYYGTMMEVFQGKARYDIVMVAGHLWMYDFVKKGYIEEMDYDTEDILPNIVKEITCDGKIYLSPSFCDGHMITYRKSAVKQTLGKELPAVITPQQFVETAGKMAEATGRPSVALKADASEIFTDAIPFMRMYGGDAYDEVTGKAVCDEERVIRGLENYCALKEIALEGTDQYGNDEIAEAIRENKAPLVTTWSGQLGMVYTDRCVKKEDLGFSTFSTAWNVTWSFAISANSEKKKEAADFLTYLRSKEVDRIAGEVSGCPLRMSNYREGEAEHPWYGTQVEMIANAKTFPQMPDAGDKNDIFYREIANAFAGRKSAAQAMKDAKTAVDAI